VEEIGHLFAECRKGLEQARLGILAANGVLVQAQLLYMAVAERNTVDTLQHIVATLPDMAVAIDHIAALIEATTCDAEDIAYDLDAFAAEIAERT
jgi:hypothetical protein